MLHLTEIILRLRNECPIFERRVGGTAAFKAANQPNVQLKLPHAFVVPMVENANAKNASGTAQQILERFAVIVAVDNSYDPKDGAGMSAQQEVGLSRLQMINALLGWEVVGWADTIQFNRGIHLDMVQTRLWHQFEWAFSYYVDTDRDPAELYPEYVATELQKLFVRYGNEEPIDILVTKEGTYQNPGPIDHPIPAPLPPGFPGPLFHGPITEENIER